MTITREEFKEYIHLYEEIWDWYKEHEDILAESVLDVLCEPFDFIGRSIGAIIPHTDFNIPLDLICYPH